MLFPILVTARHIHSSPARWMTQQLRLNYRTSRRQPPFLISTKRRACGLQSYKTLLRQRDPHLMLTPSLVSSQTTPSRCPLWLKPLMLHGAKCLASHHRPATVRFIASTSRSKSLRRPSCSTMDVESIVEVRGGCEPSGEPPSEERRVGVGACVRGAGEPRACGGPSCCRSMCSAATRQRSSAR